MRKINLEEFDEIGYVVYASNTEITRSLISRSKIVEKLRELKYVELIETDMTSS